MAEPGEVADHVGLKRAKEMGGVAEASKASCVYKYIVCASTN